MLRAISELSKNWRDFNDYLDEVEGDITDPGIQEFYEKIVQDRETAIDNLYSLKLEYEAQINKYKTEEVRLANKRKTLSTEVVKNAGTENDKGTKQVKTKFLSVSLGRKFGIENTTFEKVPDRYKFYTIIVDLPGTRSDKDQVIDQIRHEANTDVEIINNVDNKAILKDYNGDNPVEGVQYKKSEFVTFR